ncbi:hypothetical protein NPIL_1241 [Nephila pilipes]|uniref:Uncharacterized protein n=1 Tax=Nephila pilipes TaxID=299642 RepID=A0A8X6N815_NEPPI|nr:hypothetical protein NPIL_1241 [Nephila pilipes]
MSFRNSFDKSNFSDTRYENNNVIGNYSPGFKNTEEYGKSNGHVKQINAYFNRLRNDNEEKSGMSNNKISKNPENINERIAELLPFLNESNIYGNSLAHKIISSENFFEAFKSKVNKSQDKSIENVDSELRSTLKLYTPSNNLNTYKSGSHINRFLHRLDKYEMEMKRRFDGHQDGINFFGDKKWKTGYAFNGKPQSNDTFDTKNGYNSKEEIYRYGIPNNTKENRNNGEGLTIKSHIYNSERNGNVIDDYRNTIREQSSQSPRTLDDERMKVVLNERVIMEEHKNESNIDDSDTKIGKIILSKVFFENGKEQLVDKNGHNLNTHRRSYREAPEPYIQADKYETYLQEEDSSYDKEYLVISSAQISEQKHDTLASDYESAEENTGHRSEIHNGEVEMGYLSPIEYSEYSKDGSIYGDETDLKVRVLKREVHGEEYINKDRFVTQNKDVIIGEYQRDTDLFRDRKGANHIGHINSADEGINTTPISESEAYTDRNEGSFNANSDGHRIRGAKDHILSVKYENDSSNNDPISKKAHSYARSDIKNSYGNIDRSSEYRLHDHTDKYYSDAHGTLSGGHEDSKIEKGFKSLYSVVGFQNDEQSKQFEKETHADEIRVTPEIDKYTDTLGENGYVSIINEKEMKPRTSTIFESARNKVYKSRSQIEANTAPILQNVSPYIGFGSTTLGLRVQARGNGADSISSTENVKGFASGILTKFGEYNDSLSNYKLNSHKYGTLHVRDEKEKSLKAIELDASGGTKNYMQAFEAISFSNRGNGFRSNVDDHSHGEEYFHESFSAEIPVFQIFRNYTEINASDDSKNKFKSNIKFEHLPCDIANDDSTTDDIKNSSDASFYKIGKDVNSNSGIYKHSSFPEKYASVSSIEKYKDFWDEEEINREHKNFSGLNNKSEMYNAPGGFPGDLFVYSGKPHMFNNVNSTYSVLAEYRNPKVKMYNKMTGENNSAFDFGGEAAIHEESEHEYGIEAITLGDELSPSNTREHLNHNVTSGSTNFSVSSYINNKEKHASSTDKRSRGYRNKQYSNITFCADKQGSGEETEKCKNKAASNGLQSLGKVREFDGSENADRDIEKEEAMVYRGSRRLLMYKEEKLDAANSFSSKEEGYSDAIYGESESRYMQHSNSLGTKDGQHFQNAAGN